MAQEFQPLKSRIFSSHFTDWMIAGVQKDLDLGLSLTYRIIKLA